MQKEANVTKKQTAGPGASLNVKQKRFVEEYLIDLNATQAAIRAGYSEKTAYSSGQRLLKHVEIQAAIQKRQSKRAVRTEVTQDRLINELAWLGFSDLRKVATWDTTPDSIKLTGSADIDDDTAAALSEFSLTPTGFKVKLHDKLGALDKLARHLGMYSEAQDTGEAPSLNITISAAEPVGDVRVTRSES